MTAGILAGGVASRLPEGASVAAAPTLRPLPGGGGRVFVGLLGGGALPAFLLPGARHPAAAWVLVPGADGAVLLGGDALVEAPGAAMVAVPPMAPARPPLTRPAPAEARPAPEAAASRGGFRLLTGQGPVDLPFAALERILPMPPLHPMPGMPPGARGMGWTALGPVLVLGAAVGEEPLLALVVVEGRRLGLPCRGAAPVPRLPEGPGCLGDPALLAAAPLAVAPPVRAAVPTRPLLLARAEGADLALPLEEVVAVLPPVAPGHAGATLGDASRAVVGIVAHRGEVLPVLDAGPWMGRGPVVAVGRAVPMIRLRGAAPLALAVSAVAGLRVVAEAEIVTVPGGGPVEAAARLDGAVVPVLRAAALHALANGASPRPPGARA